jgi:glutamine amidotransferase
MTIGRKERIKQITVIDYGMGNIRSVVSALTRLHDAIQVSSDITTLRKSDGLILPGVGAFGAAMKNLRPLQKALTSLVLDEKKPILGICLGMQLFADDSEEHGYNTGLGWIRAHVKKLAPPNNLSLPHVGWNQVDSSSDLTSLMFTNVPKGSKFYFDHSYHFVLEEDISLAKTEYGLAINSAVVKENIWGVQFHPEKSQINGLRVINNFLRMVPSGKEVA